MLKDWGITALNTLLALVFVLASVLLQGSVVKSRTLLTILRCYFHLVMPFVTVFCLINIGWRLALMSLFVWALGLALTRFFIARIERPAERAQSVESARSGAETVIYLRSFAAADAMHGIEDLLKESASSYEASDYLRFQLTPIALGQDDRTGFPKLTTPDSDWWQQFDELAAKSAAIFLLPLIANADPEAGIVRETAHVLLRYPEKVIVIVPNAETWQSLPRAPGEPFDAFAKWSEVRDHLTSVRPLVNFPDYLPSGFVFYLTHSGKSDLMCHALTLSTAGVRSALTEVTKKTRQESKRVWKEFESEFKALNGGVSYDDYYSQPGKKLPPRMPL